MSNQSRRGLSPTAITEGELGGLGWEEWREDYAAGVERLHFHVWMTKAWLKQASPEDRRALMAAIDTIRGLAA